MALITVMNWPPPIAQRAPLFAPGHIAHPARAQARDVAAVLSALEENGIEVELDDLVEPMHPLDSHDNFVLRLADEDKARALEVIDQVKWSIYLKPREFLQIGCRVGRGFLQALGFALRDDPDALRVIGRIGEGMDLAAEIPDAIGGLKDGLGADDIERWAKIVAAGEQLIHAVQADAAGDSGVAFADVPTPVAARMRSLIEHLSGDD